MRDVVIVEAVRTPIGRRGGTLKDVHPVALAALVLKELLARAGIDPALVGDVIFGCVSQHGEQGMNVARNAWLAAGLPITTPASTVDRQCGSSQQAIHFAANLISAGVCEVTIAGGVESMTRVPILSSFEDCGSAYAPELTSRYDLVHQGTAAELIARKYGISRQAMDEFGVRSHQLASGAAEKGYLRSQVVPIEVEVDGHRESFERDECIRPNASYEAAAALPPAFDPEHSITAANSSAIADGAAAVLLMAKETALELGLRPRARLLAQAVVGCDPVLMLEGPIPATPAVLKRAGLRLEEVDLFEVNEAFASVVLAWAGQTGAPLEKTNVNGGAIALGHPLGATGARLMCHLLSELERRDLRYGLETICCGGGIGTATVIDRGAG